MADAAVVCGATGGLGPAVVQMFAERGDQVVAVARSSEELERLSANQQRPLRIEAVDLTAPAEVEELWNRIRRNGLKVRWMVYVAGGFAGGRLVETSPQTFEHMKRLNLDTAWYSCRAGSPIMEEAGGGAIVNVASRAGLVNEAGSAAYSVTKAAVIKLTQVLAEELKGSGVRVNAVVPAVIDTPSNRRSMPARLLANAVAPEAIARVIGFLCSDEAAPITGGVIPVSGRF